MNSRQQWSLAWRRARLRRPWPRPLDKQAMSLLDSRNLGRQSDLLFLKISACEM